MRILFIMDRLEKLQPRYDSTLFLLKECYRRGHETWFVDLPQIDAENHGVFALAQPIRPAHFPKGALHLKTGHKYILGDSRKKDLREFDLILIRKEPPFDMNYVFVTYLLETVAKDVFISNHPRGIRNTNEKLGCLSFASWMPKTLVTNQIDSILDFQKKLNRDLVIKPLDQKGGNGVERIRLDRRQLLRDLRKWTQKETQRVMVQEFIGEGPGAFDKRVTLLDGKVFWSFEKRSPGREFRTNLDRGAKAFRVPLSTEENALIREMRPYLKTEGLHLVGLDIIRGKLIDFNVTCPGGLAEAIPLHSKQPLVASWADFLEAQVRNFSRRRAA